MKKNNRQLAMFIIVGGLNTLVGYSLYAGFIFTGMSYFFAVLLSTCLGILFNFQTTGNIVFGKTGNSAFLKFVLVYGVIFFCNIMLIRLIQLFTDDLYLAGFLALIPVAILAFVLNKYMVFRERYEAN